MQYTNDPLKKLQQIQAINSCTQLLEQVQSQLFSSHCPSSGHVQQVDAAIKILQGLAEPEVSQDKAFDDSSDLSEDELEAKRLIDEGMTKFIQAINEAARK